MKLRSPASKPGLPLAVVGRREVSLTDLAATVRALAVMVSARLPLVDALDAVARQARTDRLREVWLDAARRVRRGVPFSDALAAQADAVGPLLGQVGRVGEATGTLDVVLVRLADHLESAHALRRKLRLALVYPALVLTVAGGAVVFLLLVVVPTFADLFADFDAPLPGPTRVVVTASEALRDHALVGAVVLVALGLGIRAALASEAGATAWDRVRLRLPVFGALARTGAAARVSRTLGTLLESGVPLVEALGVAAGSAENRVVAAALVDGRRRVERGSALAGPLRQSRVFPSLLVDMVGVGEATGRLDEVLGQTAEHFEREVDASVEALTSVIEPVLVVLLGVIVGGILVAIYLPMFDLVTVLR